MLKQNDCKFSLNKNGFLQAEINGENVGRVKIVCTQPLTNPYEYISVISMEDVEHGIIKNITDFDDEQRELILNNINSRYFCPVITEIASIKDKMGSFYFDVVIGKTPKNFMVRDLTKNIRQQGNTVTITDMDGNRYKIEDIDKINSKSRKKLEPYLY